MRLGILGQFTLALWTAFHHFKFKLPHKILGKHVSPEVWYVSYSRSCSDLISCKRPGRKQNKTDALTRIIKKHLRQYVRVFSGAVSFSIVFFVQIKRLICRYYSPDNPGRLEPVIIECVWNNQKWTPFIYLLITSFTMGSLFLLSAFFLSVLSDDEVLLSPEVSFGPPGVILSCPVAMTISHCAAVSGDWSVRLKRQTHGDTWEVSELLYYYLKLCCERKGKCVSNAEV